MLVLLVLAQSQALPQMLVLRLQQSCCLQPAVHAKVCEQVQVQV